MSTTASAVSSFSKALVLGEIHEDMVFPYPRPDEGEAKKVSGLIASFREYAAEHVDSRRIDEERWIPDEVYTELGRRGLMGLYVPEEYGGQGLSQTGYARVFEAIGQADGSLTVGMGVHQSIGMKGSSCSGPTRRRSASSPTWRAGESSPASRSRSPAPGRTPSTCSRARSPSLTARGC